MPDSGTGPLSPRNATLFRILAVLLPVAAFGLIEVGCRIITARGPKTDPYINISPVSVFTRVRSGGEEYFRLTHRNTYFERDITVPVRKPPNGMRVVSLGGSACAGWPHPSEETFDRYLAQALGNAFPDRSVEVVNAAAHGFASYRVRRVFDEVLSLDPDVVIVYSGNNEFLEDRDYRAASWPVVETLSRNLRVVQWLQAKLVRPATRLSGDELKDAASFFYKRIKRQALELRQDPVKFARVKAHYAASIEHIVAEAGARGVRVLLFTVPVNLRDWLPTVSYNGLEGERLQEWRRLFDLGRRGLLMNRPQEGLQAMRQALALEPGHAESHYWMGRLSEALGDGDQALASYRAARDLDYNPFRAHGDFNRLLREIGDANDHVTVVDLESEFERLSERGIPGFDLFLDYVHPNKRGNLAIAEGAFRALAQDDGVEFQRGVSPPGSHGNDYDERSDSELQVRLFGLYAQNHQYEAAIRKGIDLAEMASGAPVQGEPEQLPPELPPAVREGYQAFRRFRDVQRRDILGQPVDPAERERVRGELDTYLEKWFGYGSF